MLSGCLLQHQVRVTLLRLDHSSRVYDLFALTPL